MVARRNTKAPLERENGFYDLNCSSHTANEPKSSAMKIYGEDKENHLIEAIVFTTDFLSCTEKQLKGSRWICGSGASIETGDSLGSSDDDGCFGVKCRQLISYKNAEDLTQKVNDLFHHERTPLSPVLDAEIKKKEDDCCQLMFQRKRSPLSAGAAAEIRDDFAEEDDCFILDESDRRFFSNLQRTIDDTTSTCPSTNPSLSHAELNHWYSSSWSSFTYHGSAKDTDASLSVESTGLKSKNRRQMSTSRFGTSSEREYAPIEARSSSSMPDFLDGVEFKDSSYKHRTISLPPPLPICEEEKVLNQTQNEIEATNSVKALGHVSKEKPCSRRLGRKLRAFWKKTQAFFRRGG